MIKFFSIIIIVFAAFNISAQTTNNCKTLDNKSFVYSLDKNGKKSTKDCQYVVVCDHAIEFRATATSVMTLYKITETKWETMGGKVADLVVQKDGSKAFWVSDKKAFVLLP